MLYNQEILINCSKRNWWNLKRLKYIYTTLRVIFQVWILITSCHLCKKELKKIILMISDWKQLQYYINEKMTEFSV